MHKRDGKNHSATKELLNAEKPSQNSSGKLLNKMKKNNLWQYYISGVALLLVILSAVSLSLDSKQLQQGQLSEIQNIDIIKVTRDESVVKQAEAKPPMTTRIIENSTATIKTPEAVETSISTYVAEKREDGILVDKNGKKYPIRQYSTLALPNDPNASQWWTTQSKLEAAWDIGAGSNPVIVAVLDTGFDLEHEELSNRWFVNSGESGATAAENASDLNCTDQAISLDESCNNIDDDFDGILDNESGITTTENPSRLNCTDQVITLDKSCNLVDDDSNGLVDDVKGWDFANFDQVVEAGETNPTGSGTTHGTNVSGVVGANANNSVGIAGVNWTTTILPIQVFTDDSYADTLIISRAIRYAADMGADVINLSLGSWFSDSYMRDAISDAIDAGVVVVAASGNDGCSDCILYPANYPEVVAVGSLSIGGGISSFTSYGNNLDLLAPGSSMTSSTWSNSNNSSYAIVSGTSFSSPFVAGLLALGRSHQPDATWTEIIAAMLENTDKSVLSDTHSNVFGFGLADAEKFITRTTTPRTDAYETRLTPLMTTNTLSSELTYQCDNPLQGSTSLYQLVKSGSYKYTVNEHEKYQLQNSGWVDSFFGHVCVGLPDDDSAQIRNLNLIVEFANKSVKSLN